jgi:hypothetical protein
MAMSRVVRNFLSKKERLAKYIVNDVGPLTCIGLKQKAGGVVRNANKIWV